VYEIATNVVQLTNCNLLHAYSCTALVLSKQHFSLFNVWHNSTFDYKLRTIEAENSKNI